MLDALAETLSEAARVAHGRRRRPLSVALRNRRARCPLVRAMERVAEPARRRRGT